MGPWRELACTTKLVAFLLLLVLAVGPDSLAEDELLVTIPIDADVSAGRLTWEEPLVVSAPVEIRIEVSDASYVMNPETDPSVRFVIRHAGDRACWGRVLQDGRQRWDVRDGALEFSQVPVQNQGNVWVGAVQVSLCSSVTHLMVCQKPLFQVPFFGVTLQSGVYPTGVEPPSQESCSVALQPGDSIQTAIDRAHDGAVICVGAGVWEENITIARSLTLRGAGAEETEITGSRGSRRPVLSVLGHRPIQVVIQDLAVTGDGSPLTHGLLLSGHASVHITGLIVSRHGGCGIRMTDSAQALIEHTTITRNYWGVRLFDSSQLTIRSCTVSEHHDLPDGSHGCGIGVNDNAQATILDCTITRNDHGILGFQSANGTVRDSTISHNRYTGIKIAHASRFNVERNALLSNGHYGIMLAQTQQGSAYPPAAFSGEITGSNNTGFGNGWGDVWPSVLSFLPSGTSLLDFLMSAGGTVVNSAEPEDAAVESRRDTLLRVEADPKAGFHWPYFLFVPAGVRDQPYLLVEPNNTGTGDDDPDVHESSARVLASSRYPTTMARELRIPLLVPTFPRPRTDWHIYTHALSRDAMTVQRGNLARVDLQLVQMIQDAQKRLRGSGIDAQEKVLMHGYSASGVFTGRFALMHPEVLKAYACGGFSDSFITLPADDWQRVSLPYPVGIRDLRTLTGVGFDLEAFSQVSGYYYRGEEDDNPCLGMPACYDPIHADLIRRLFGRDRHDRWEAIQNVFAGLGVTAEFVTHPGLGHTITAGTISGVVDFFRRIMEDG